MKNTQLIDIRNAAVEVVDADYDNKSILIAYDNSEEQDWFTLEDGDLMEAAQAKGWIEGYWEDGQVEVYIDLADDVFNMSFEDWFRELSGIEKDELMQQALTSTVNAAFCRLENDLFRAAKAA